MAYSGLLHLGTGRSNSKKQMASARFPALQMFSVMGGNSSVQLPLAAALPALGASLQRILLDSATVTVTGGALGFEGRALGLKFKSC